MALTASGNITNQPAGVILAGGSMNLTSTAAPSSTTCPTQRRHRTTSASSCRTARSRFPRRRPHQPCWIDSNSGNVNITAARVDISPSPERHDLDRRRDHLPGTLGNVGNDNMFAGTVFPRSRCTIRSPSISP